MATASRIESNSLPPLFNHDLAAGADLRPNQRGLRVHVDFAAGTVYTRINRLAASDGVVGYALDALREAYYGEQASKLILIEYQALTRAPADTMRLLYDMLGEPLFAHDFDNVDYDASEFDAALGAHGLHEVKRRVEWKERATILPPGLMERFIGDMFWRLPEANFRGVTHIQYGEHSPT